MKIIMIGLGGALGSVCRYLLSSFIALVFGQNFPLGTLCVNVSGSLIMGFLFVLFFDRLSESPLWRLFFLTGILGGYTTFSSFSIETLVLFESGAWFLAFLNIILSLVLCLLAVWFGAGLARILW